MLLKRLTAVWVAAAVALGAAAPGCARTTTKVEPVMPALAVPPPPPRVLPPLEDARIDSATPAPNQPQSAPRQPPRQRPDASRAANGAGRTGEGRAETAAPVPSDGAPSAEGESAQAAPSLQLASPGDSASEQKTRNRLTQAAQNLQRVDYRQLNTDAKAQYDIAKRFIALAEQAITDRNLLYAQTLADKAATIAGVLQRR